MAAFRSTSLNFSSTRQLTNPMERRRKGHLANSGPEKNNICCLRDIPLQSPAIIVKLSLQRSRENMMVCIKSREWSCEEQCSTFDGFATEIERLEQPIHSGENYPIVNQFKIEAFSNIIKNADVGHVVFVRRKSYFAETVSFAFD